MRQRRTYTDVSGHFEQTLIFMNKAFKITLGIISFFIIVIVLLLILFQSAFGPTHKKLKLKLTKDIVLFCEETYTADFAGVFYDVDFYTKNEGIKTKIGSATFYEDDWQKDFSVFKKINEWYIIKIENTSGDRVFAINIREARMDELLKDGIADNQEWKLASDIKYRSGIIFTKERLDSINGNNFFYEYEFRLGFNKPFEFYKQNIVYELDLATGKLEFKNISEKQELIKNAR